MAGDAAGWLPESGFRFQLDLPVTRGNRMPTIDIDSNAALEEYLDRAEQRPAS